MKESSSKQKKEAKAFTFYRIETKEIRKSAKNKKRLFENYQIHYSNEGPSLTNRKPLTQEEAVREAIAIDIYKRFSILEEARPIIKTMAYSDKYKQILDSIFLDKLNWMGLWDFERRAIPGGSNHHYYKVSGYACGQRAKTNVNTKESDSENDKDNCIKKNCMRAPIYGPKSLKYLICNDPMDHALSLQETLGTHDEKLDLHDPNILVNMRPATKTRYNTKLAHLLSKPIYSPSIVDWEVLNNMGYAEEIENMLEINVYEAGSQYDIFSCEAWRRSFDTNEPINTELCHKFCSTYEFDEVCADDELRTKKVIKFQLYGRTYSLTLLEFARRLGIIG
nr:hypothetical protein [Tanacetum cinerariifolium]